MTEKRKYFGTDGIRGVAIKPPLDPETLVRLGQAIAKALLKKKGKNRILIGKDTRLSGYMIESSLAAGITSMGVNVLLVGPIPTPGVAYLTRSMRADAGIMISASHNAFEDNGIKIFGGDGFKLDDTLELELESYMDQGVVEEDTADPGSIGKARRIDDAVGRYTVYLKSCFPRDLSVEDFKIGFDCAHGAAYVSAPQTFEELGADVVTRGATPNGKNINAGFGSLYPEIVRNIVLENNLNLGVALDGDADRCILVDEKGNILDGDTVMAICAIDRKSRGKLPGNTVVGTVMSNLGLEKLLEGNGIKLERTKVGDRYVLEKMREVGSVLGGEQSGHTIFLRHGTTGDGTLTALMVLAIMCGTEKTLSELASVYQPFPQKLINIPVVKKPAFSEVEPIQKAIENAQEKLKNSGRILVRYSGTENKARVMVESENEDDCDKYASDVATAIEKEIGSV